MTGLIAFFILGVVTGALYLGIGLRAYSKGHESGYWAGYEAAMWSGDVDRQGEK